MFKIQTLNNISVLGLERLPRDRYEVGGSDQHRISTLTDGVYFLDEIFHDGNLLFAQRPDKIRTQIRMLIEES